MTDIPTQVTDSGVINRYALHETKRVLVLDATGNWVHMTDFWTIKMERDSLRDKLAKMSAKLLEAADALDGIEATDRHSEEHFAEYADELRSAAALQSSNNQPEVIP